LRRSTEISDKLDPALEQNKNNVQLENKVSQLKDKLESINANSNDLNQLSSIQDMDKLVQADKDFIVSRSKELTDSVTQSKNILDEIMKLISDTPTSSNITISDIYILNILIF
jgi:predicted  nucleic acid-binding Zn-ribbon protein